jgi:hypothetical protein
LPKKQKTDILEYVITNSTTKEKQMKPNRILKSLLRPLGASKRRKNARSRAAHPTAVKKPS